MSESWPSPVATATTTLRVLYAELVTIVVTSVLATVASLAVVTLGPALLAAVEVLTTIVTRRDTGAPPSERERAALFVDAFRRNLRAGLPFGLLLAAVGVVTGAYYAAGVARGDGGLLLLSLVGAYGLLAALALTLRVGSFRARSAPPPAREAVRLAGRSFASHWSYTVLYLVALGGVLLVAGYARIVVPLLLPGALAAFEVVAYEAVAGDGARTVAPETGLGK